MSEKYAVPCICGATVAVEIRQAGDRVQCPQCSEFVEVPRLRELREHEVVSSAEKSSSGYDTTKWGGLPGGLFALGLLSIVIAGAAAAYTYESRSRYEDYAEPPSEKITFERDINDISLIDSWVAWGQFKDFKVSSRVEPFHVMARGKISELDNWLLFFGGLATLGLIFILLSLILRATRRG